MKVTKKQARKNRAEVRAYWHSYLGDGHIMAWLFADVDGDVWMESEPQGQTSKICHSGQRVVHDFGDFYRAHGALPEHITLKDFTAGLNIDEYLSSTTYQIINVYDLADDPRIFRSPIRALEEEKRREGEGWIVIERETDKRIMMYGESWTYME